VAPWRSSSRKIPRCTATILARRVRPVKVR
jgi:hypothetical protein